MPEHDGLMRIFWPLDIPRTDSPGIIVGWKNSGLDVFVVAILEDVEVSSEMAQRWIFWTDVEKGAQRGKCPEGWDFISQCQSSHLADLRAMRATIDACFRLGKFAASRS